MNRVIIIYEDNKYKVIGSEQLANTSEIKVKESYPANDNTKTVWITLWANSEKIFRESAKIKDVILQEEDGSTFILRNPKMWLTNGHRNILEIYHDKAEMCTQDAVLEVINQMTDVSEEYDFKFTRLRVVMTHKDYEDRPDYYLVEKEFNYTIYPNLISNNNNICIVINTDIRRDYIRNTPIQQKLSTITLEDRYGYKNSEIQNPKLYVVGDTSIIIGECTLISEWGRE